MARNYDKTYLEGLIAKAKKSWEGVDVDSYMSGLRDNDMKTIQERAREYILNANNIIELPARRYGCSVRQVSRAYIAGAKDQQYIDRLFIEHYIDKACNIFCHTGCPHKKDSYNCLNDKCDTWKVFKRMMEEEK